MKLRLLYLLPALVLGALAWPLWDRFPAVANEASSEHSPRLLVHLLDYLAVDYGGAVQGGKVVNLLEYKEQLEFSKTVVELSQTLPEVSKSPEILSRAKDLSRLIRDKAAAEKVAAEARGIQASVLKAARLPVAPAQWPNLTSGEFLFQNACAKCHGPHGRGDGPSAYALNPKPVDFQDPVKMSEVSPFHSFNAIRLGVPGTGMTAFPHYSDQDTWNLAFYVASLRYQDRKARSDYPFGQSVEKVRSLLKLSPGELLTKAATHPDALLEKELPGGVNERTDLLADLRLHSFSGTAQASLDFARALLHAALEDYRGNHFDAASRKALRAYLEGVEPIEPRLKANNPKAVMDLERYMGLVRSSMNDRQPPPEVETAVQKAMDALRQASGFLDQDAPSAGLTFTLAFGILLREGFEAALLIVALLGVLRVWEARKAARWVHGGWMAAVGLGLAAWFFSGWLMGLGGLEREILEGVTALLTVAILLYIGFWLHSRTEIHRWKSFIEVKVKSALQERNLLQLAFISFLAAFREVFETVLFLRAIWLEGGSEAKWALGGGVVCAFVLILILGWLLLAFSAKIPIKTFFNASSVLMVVLAVILAGKAVHSFQEVDLMGITLSPLNLHWDWLGIYPTRETLLAQAFTLCLSLFLWLYGKRPPVRK